MTLEELKLRVDEIIAAGDDPEHSHLLEDRLMDELLKEFCPEWVSSEFDRVSEADLERWYA